MRITPGDLSNAHVIALLNEHLKELADHSPPESVHALNLDGLRAPDVTFWTVWNPRNPRPRNDSIDGCHHASRGVLLGCGALKELDPRHGEIKSMRTAHAHLRNGVASAMLRHIIKEATARSYHRLSLETGSGAAFAPAHALYEKFGFTYCGPFGEYRDDAFSRFMTLEVGLEDLEI